MKALVAAVAGSLVLTSAAVAGTASLSTYVDRYGEGQFAPVYLAAPGEANDLTLTFDQQTRAFRFRDTVGVTPASQCRRPGASDATVVDCPLNPNVSGYPTPGVVVLGDGDDRANAHSQRLEGGPGNDTLTGGSWVLPGPGDDTIIDGSLVDFARRADGADTVMGNTDTVSYGPRRKRVTVSLDSNRDDGERGERDLIEPPVRVVQGGLGDDRMVGNDAGNWFAGGAGADVLIGGAGDDYLDASAGRTRDRLNGGAGDDRLIGSQGSNLIQGGPGFDRIRAGKGRDTINARDHAEDRIDCGPGLDTAIVDRGDSVRHCERVRRA